MPGGFYFFTSKPIIMYKFILICSSFLFCISCTDKPTSKAILVMENTSTAKSEKELSCKLTSQELRERKTNVLEVLKQEVKEKKELPNGYSFRFAGSDTLIDQLVTFIKSERQCCDFFTFSLKIADEKSGLWLDITGPDGAKEFIKTEMEL